MHEMKEQQQEIMGPVRALKNTYGRPAILFRPPYGEYNDDRRGREGARPAIHLVEHRVRRPGPHLSADAILSRVQKRLTPGSVIVLRTNGKQNTLEVTEALAGTLLGKKGLRAMTVSDLLQCNQPTSDPTH